MRRFKELYAVIVRFPTQARVFTSISDSGRIYTIYILDIGMRGGSLVTPITRGRVLHLDVNHNIRIRFRLNSNAVPCFIYTNPTVITVVQDAKASAVWESNWAVAFDTDNNIETEDSPFCQLDHCDNIGFIESDYDSEDSGNVNEWSESENP